jgi:hypothetical protein
MVQLGHGGGATRLDGLPGLLDTGTNPSVRRMAAGQIGEIVAAHPSEARPVLGRVRQLLVADSWDTRVAAGHALAAIAEQAPRFVPTRPVADTNCKHEDAGSVCQQKEEPLAPSGPACAKDEDTLQHRPVAKS